MLYPTSNYFDSWVLHIPLNRQMTPTLILRERHEPTQYLKKNKVLESVKSLRQLGLLLQKVYKFRVNNQEERLAVERDREVDVFEGLSLLLLS